MPIVPDDRYAALYVRVSSAGQLDSWSIKDQLALAKLAAPGRRVLVFDGDLAVSGQTIEARKDIQRLLKEIEAGRVAEVICVDWNRLSRDEDLIDSLRIKKACKDAGCVIKTVGKTFDFESESDEQLSVLQAMFASNQNSARTKVSSRSQYQKAGEGRWLGGQAPYGYAVVFDVPHRDGHPRGRLVPHPEEAAVVRECYTLYADGVVGEDGKWRPLSERAVAEELNRRGHRFRERVYRDPAKRRYPQGRAWGPMDVRRVLTNRLYVGYAGWGRTRVTRWARDIGTVEAEVPALRLVDAGLFLRAQQVRAERRKVAPRLGCPTRALAGLLRCPHCGALAVGMSQSARGGSREKAVNYLCGAFRHYGAHREGGCPAGGYQIREALAVGAVNAALRELFARLDFERALDEAEAEARAAADPGQEQSLRQALDDVGLRRQRLLDEVEAGNLRGDEVRERRDALDAERERLTVRLEAVRTRRREDGALSGAAASLRGGGLAERLGWLAAEQPATYRKVVALFYESLVVEGAGGSRNRTAEVTAYRLTPAAQRLLSPENTFGTSALTHVPKARGADGPLWPRALALLAP